MSKLPNLAQWMVLLRTLIPFVGGLLVMNHVMTATEFSSLVDQLGKLATDVVVLIGMLAPVITAIWGMINRSDKNVVVAASEIPGVQVTVNGKAPVEVKQVALDPAVPNVIVQPPAVKAS